VTHTSFLLPSSLEDQLRQAYTGRRILLAEDNPVNQEVAEELLRCTGLVVDTVADGAAAVQKATTTFYDVILMDVHMPVMGGMDATRTIRSRRGTGTPIIAMTADTFAEDRKACLDAGMNDHVPKPVDPEVLYAAMLQWLPFQSRTANGPAAPLRHETPDPPDEIAAKLRRVPGLDFALGMRLVGGQLKTLVRVLCLFVDTYARSALVLVVPGVPEQRASWQAACHSLRGACASIGATRLTELAAQIDSERVAGASNLALSLSSARLQDELLAFVGELSRALKHNPK